MDSGVFTFFLEQWYFEVFPWKASMHETKSHLDPLFPGNVSQFLIHFAY